MKELSRRSRFVLGMACAGALAAGCDNRGEPAAADSLLMRDLTLAASSRPPASLASLGDTAATAPGRTAPSVSPRAADPVPAPSRAPSRPAAPRAPERQPQRQPAPARPAPGVGEPAPVAAPAGETAVPAASASTRSASPGTGAGRRTLGSGTMLVGRTDAEICSIANRPGDRFVATMTQDATGPDGARIPAGTPVLVEMAQPADGDAFAFRVKAVQVDGTLIPIEGTVRAEGTPTERRVSKGGDKGKVVTGAVVGAILGRVLGGGTRGTVIGAAGGAAAGTVAAARNSVTERCLPAGATLTVTLSAPLVLTPGAP